MLKLFHLRLMLLSFMHSSRFLPNSTLFFAKIPVKPSCDDLLLCMRARVCLTLILKNPKYIPYALMKVERRNKNKSKVSPEWYS